MNSRLLLSIHLLLGSFLSAYPSSAYASPNTKGSLEASPAFTEVVLQKPDDVKHVVFTYTNYATKPLTLKLSAIDFKQADGTGAISFLGVEAGSFSYSLSSFLSFETNTLQLAGGETKTFTVTIKNRDDISPGGHYAAVIAQVASEDQLKGANLAPSVSSLILLRKVGGERFHLSLSSVDFPKHPIAFSYPATITALFQNEGNVHVVPYGTVEIKDMFGRVLYKGIINTSSLRIFPETRRYIKIDMQEVHTPWPVSLNTITFSGQDSLQKITFSSQSMFVYIHYGVLILFFLGVLLGVLRVRQKRKRRQNV